MRTYYVSSSLGNDAHDGLSEQSAFASLGMVNALSLGPGDRVLLRRGDTFTDQYLHPRGSGAPDSPITIGAYGEADAPAPHIAANGSGVWQQDYRAPIGGSPHRNRGPVSTAVLLRDMAYVEVRDLEISNRRVDDTDGLRFNDLEVMDRTGVAVIAENAGTIRHVLLERLHVHDVDGNIYTKHMANGGIQVLAHMPEITAGPDANPAISRFDDIRITGCRVERTTRWGIAVGYTAWLNMIDHGARDERGAWTNTFDYGDGTIADETLETYGATNVRIDHNIVEDAGGDAITVMYALRPLVDHNISRRAARFIRSDIYTATANDRVAAAIWPWRCKDAVFEYNEAYATLNADHGNGDGQAWDADFGDGTIYRHNYSSGNSGGTVMFCEAMAVRSEFVGNTAVNDHMGAIDIPKNPDAWVHGNTFLLADDCEPLRLDRATGAALIERNNFIRLSAVSHSKEEEQQQTKRATVWHPEGSDVRWRANIYVGFEGSPPEDGEALSS